MSSSPDRAKPFGESFAQDLKGGSSETVSGLGAEIGLAPKTVVSLVKQHPQADSHLSLSDASHAKIVESHTASTSASGEGTERDSDARSQIWFGKYEVIRLLGRGGMGEVWLVRHLTLKCLRAIKKIHLRVAKDSQYRQMFDREAEILANFSHPNAVIVHDHHVENEAAYIVMEYLHGKPLDEMLAPGEPRSLDWIVMVLDQLCDVLYAAHSKRIVHRDLKPSNIMLCEDESHRPHQRLLKALDFGLAKIVPSNPEDDASVHNFCGTPSYASPEQFREEAIDHRCDIYSLGVILFQFLTGKLPFEGKLFRLSEQHRLAPPPSFAEIQPRLRYPAGVEDLVRQCLAKSPDQRPQSAREISLRFRQALGVSSPSLNTTLVDSFETPISAEESTLPPAFSKTPSKSPMSSLSVVSESPPSSPPTRISSPITSQPKQRPWFLAWVDQVRWVAVVVTLVLMLVSIGIGLQNPIWIKRSLWVVVPMTILALGMPYQILLPILKILYWKSK